MANTLGSLALAAEVTRHRGSCAFFRGDYSEAERHYRESLALARRAERPVLEAKAAGNLGLLGLRRRRYDEAADWLNKALDLATRLKGDLEVVKILLRMGWSHYLLGDYERALAFLSRAESLAETRGYAAEHAYALQNIGNVHYRLRSLDAAGECYFRALETARRLGSRKLMAELLSNLGIVALEQARYDEAETYVREALRIKEGIEDYPAKQHSLQAEGQIWEGRGDYDKAEALYREVLGSPHSKGELLWETRASLASLRIKTKRPIEAEAEFRKAFAIMEESRGELRQTEHKISFFSSLGQFYDNYVDFLVEGGKTRQALEVADRSRARLLRELLEIDAKVPLGTVARFRNAARGLDAVILFYWLAPSRSFLWAVTPRGVRLHVLPAEAEIRERVEAHQALILQGRDPLAEGAPEALWLYRTLVGPVEASLPPGSRIVVVPDGPLHQINPETLVAASPAPHYWIEDVTLMTAPSVSVLAAAGGGSARPGGQKKSILMIGDPLPEGDEFPRLVHASRELGRIAEQFAPSEQTVFSGAQADPTSYRASEPGRFSYIHFAAHAQANREVPLESAVILSARNESSKLYAREIVGVPLRAELVTLSACRTAGARTFAGEGLVGLTWAFLSSGAGNVVAGLWNVEDASTAELMADLYRGLAQGQGPAEALRRAKLDLQASDPAYRKPFYWAPFVIYTRGPGSSRRSARPSGT